MKKFVLAAILAELLCACSAGSFIPAPGLDPQRQSTETSKASNQAAEPQKQPEEKIVFRDFVMGESSFKDVMLAVEKNTTLYSKHDNPNAYTIRALSTIEGEKAHINFYFHNNKLVIVDIALTEITLLTNLRNYLTKNFKNFKSNGYYKYPNIKVDYTHTCDSWGDAKEYISYKNSFPDACTDSPVTLSTLRSRATYSLNIDHIDKPSYAVLKLVYQHPKLANEFREYQAKIETDKDNAEKEKNAQSLEDDL